MDQQKLIQAYREAFSTQAGQIVLADIMRRSGVFQTTPDNQNDPIAIVRKDARADLGKEIGALFGYHDHDFAQIMTQARHTLNDGRNRHSSADITVGDYTEHDRPDNDWRY